jgi:UDP-N-acetylglucosamine 2-epimerase (non-hydrolysing)
MEAVELRAVCVAGARPNFVKIKPVLDALEARDVDAVFVHTGQHYDDAMSGGFLDDLGLRPPDRFLAVGSGSHAEQTARVLTAFEPVVADLRPDVVVVVGDVNSTLACALVAAKAGTWTAHVEAGLRSRDWAMPEEVNRVVVDRVSDFLFAPSADAADNLRLEGYRQDQVHVVGNVMIDTLLANLDRARERAEGLLAALSVAAGGYGLVTLHRPSNVDGDVGFRALLEGLERVGQRLPLLFPVHPRTRQKLAGLPPMTGLRFIEPCGYLDFLALQAGARLVLTDSGGVQEETTALGVACLTLRTTTERPVTVTEGTNTLVGTDPERIVAEADRVLSGPVAARCPPLWDGRAAVRIADVLLAADAEGPRLRPTGRPRPGG